MSFKVRGLFRAAEPQRGWRTATVLWAIFSLSVVVSLVWAYSGVHVAWMWPANAILAAGLILLPRREGLALAAACAVSNLCASVYFGAPMGLGLLFMVLNSGEAFAVAWLTRNLCGAAVDLTSRRRFFTFLGLVAGPIALTVSVLGALSTHVLFGKPLPGAWTSWFPADLLGLAVVTPAVLLFARRARYCQMTHAGHAERLALLAAIAAMTAVVFLQPDAPTLFLVFPLLVLATFRLPPPGTAAAVVIAALVAAPLTINGYGPIANAEGFDAAGQGLLLQLFLGAMLIAALPASSALAERRRMRARLTRRMAAVRAARVAAEQAGAAKTQFLAVMSHEIRTPLNGLLGFVQVMQSREDLPDEVRRQVELMAGSCDVLMALVNDVLDFSKIEAGRIELDPRPFSLAQAIESSAAMMLPGAQLKTLPIRLETEALADLTHVGDDQRISQVLMNLLSNAVKFTARGEVAVLTEVEPRSEGVDRLRVRVVDTGVGVPPDRRDRLFRMFSQADSSTTRTYGGSGLGLAISRRLVERMGGEMGYEPRHPQGSEFWFTLDLARAERELAVEPQGEGRDISGMRVLVVDDHPVNREVASLMLTAAGCVVSTAEDGAAAVEAVRAESYDLVLMDVHMPGMDGLSAARAIRALPSRARRTPILALTADTASADVGRCLEAGMDGHLSKPIRQPLLMDAVATWAGKAEMRRADAA